MSRIWHGCTSSANADRREDFLRKEICVGIECRHGLGFVDMQLLRRPVGAEVEFVTVMRFQSLEAVKRLAGEDCEACLVLVKACGPLGRLDLRSQHDEIRLAEDRAGA